jgi:tetratricopeptide (TPR) repeat protein
MRCAGLLCALLVMAAGCHKENNAVDAGTKPLSTSSEPVSPKRPPFPNMATAAWGQRVLEERVAKVHAEGPAATRDAVLDALHDMSPGSEGRAADLAATWYKSAPGNVERGEAVALLAASLALDPVVEGYKERLTDAFGLSQYAGSLDASSSLNQSARLVVWALAGQVSQARALLEVVETTPNITHEPRVFMALGQKLTGGKLDAALADLEKALEGRPSSLRVKSLLAEIYLDIGLYPEAVKVADAPQPWLQAIKGRALVLDGKVDDGIKILKDNQDKLDEGRRGDALYWLGRSLTQADGKDAEVDAIQATLAARPGYAKEAAVLQGLKLVKAGEFAKARDLIDPMVKRNTPGLPSDIDAMWLLVDACAGAGDADCVSRAGARAIASDGDYARLNLARAALGLVGKANVDVDEALKEAHRASPFDAKLAEKVKEQSVDGGAAAANRLRAARRAIVHKSPKLANAALAPVEKTATCRVCRALKAAAAGGVEAADLAVKAVEGKGPALCVADDVAVIHALGAAPTKEAVKALDNFASDKREPIIKALAAAHADHKDPEARKRRDEGSDEHEHKLPTPPGMPQINVPDMPSTPKGAP